MERNEDGRLWFVPLMKKLEPKPAAEVLHCPEHPKVRLKRLLGQRWFCTECVRRSAAD
ncbi:hypothetical protein [Streptomyces syringium]|uniref:hypothetical protein n=1 Tax=Streptomyces syringium TaxID=76729 RepID=UPI003AAF2B1F